MQLKLTTDDNCSKDKLPLPLKAKTTTENSRVGTLPTQRSCSFSVIVGKCPNHGHAV